MREITKSIAEFFESNAIENAVKIGIRNILLFGNETYSEEYENVTLYVSEDYKNFHRRFEEKGIHLCKNEPLICSLIRRSFTNEDMICVFEQLKSFPEGTTVVFIHNDNMTDKEKFISDLGFRIIEHFSADKVADALIKRKGNNGGNTAYCLCTRK